jgi:hypothetical protein
MIYIYNIHTHTSWCLCIFFVDHVVSVPHPSWPSWPSWPCRRRGFQLRRHCQRCLGATQLDPAGPSSMWNMARKCHEMYPQNPSIAVGCLHMTSQLAKGGQPGLSLKFGWLNKPKFRASTILNLYSQGHHSWGHPQFLVSVCCPSDL